MTPTTWNRRSFIRLTGVGLGAAGLGAVGAGTLPSASADTRYFDLDSRGIALYTGAKPASVTVQQSFAFDPENDRIFVAQLLAGSPGANGDLCISEMDRHGHLLGSMVLLGYGHAVSFAAQPFRGGTYLWTEGEANGNGYGTVLKRFVWQDGVTLTRDDARATTFRPVPEALETTCAIDHAAGTMAVRYHTAAGKRVAVMRLADVAAGGAPERLHDFAQPAGFGTFQGYALLGDQLYTIDGNAYSATNPYPGNCYLSRVDCATGELAERTLTTVGAELDFREPEGVAIDYNPAGKPRLYLGFATGVTGDRRSNLYFLPR